MATERLLARVRADVEAGDLGLARLRLQSALATTGSDAVRRELVRICRISGDPAAAGRYGFATDDVTEAELAAFASRHGGRATLMLRAIGFQGRLDQLGPAGRDRLRTLERRVEDDPPGVGTAPPVADDWLDVLFMTGCLLVLLALVVVLVLGVVQAWQLASGWLQ